MSIPHCPECQSENTYEYGGLFVCPDCAYEWTATTETSAMVKDANGNLLMDGDQGIVVKDIKIKGSSGVIKQGTKVHHIRLEENGAHNIVAKIDGMGLMELKSELIKKAN